MNKNILKLLAALTMVIDHAGLLLFPQTAVLRWIGRISFPLFAFCVGDGCVHTRKPWVYFWRVLGLGLACQIVFAAEELLDGGTLRGSQALYLNILFTLALPILWCYNGQPGCRGWKWAFYVFYPAHLAVLYLIGEIM